MVAVRIGWGQSWDTWGCVKCPIPRDESGFHNLR